jgi:hypothetical protein
MQSYIIQNLGEVLKRHIFLLRNNTAIASTMTTIYIASQGTFPKQLVKMMLVGTKRQHCPV